MHVWNSTLYIINYFEHFNYSQWTPFSLLRNFFLLRAERNDFPMQYFRNEIPHSAQNVLQSWREIYNCFPKSTLNGVKLRAYYKRSMGYELCNEFYTCVICVLRNSEPCWSSKYATKAAICSGTNIFLKNLLH